MKQLVFIFGVLAFATVGIMVHPFWGVIPYYTFSIIQPQNLWDWALPGNVRWSLMAAGIAMLAAILHLPRIITRARWNGVATLMLIFSGLILLSSLTAFDTGVAMEWGIIYAKILVMASLTTLLVDRLDQIRMLAYLILSTITYLAWHFNSLYFFEGRLDIFHRGLGIFDNNGAGLLIAMGTPFAYALFFMARHIFVRIALGGAVILMVHAVMMSYSRGAMLSAAIGAIWVLWHHRPRKHAIWLATGLVVVALSLAGQEIRDEFISIGDYKTDETAQFRFDSWQAAWSLAWEHPLLGTGPRNSNLFSHNYGADLRGRTIHSQYLQIAADIGLPAMLVYLAMSGLAMWGLHRSRNRLLAASKQLKTEYDERIKAATSRSARRDKPSLEEAGARFRLLRRSKYCRDMSYVMLAYQGSLVIFLTAAVFLSLEVFELHWLIIAVAGVSPGLVERYLNPQPHERRKLIPLHGPATTGPAKNPRHARPTGMPIPLKWRPS